MTERPCIRCHNPLTLEGGQLTYCGVCGAAQIFLSEELQQQAADEARRYREQASAAAAVDEAEPAAGSAPFAALQRARGRASNRWPVAVEYALLSSGVALALAVGAALFAPLLLVDWLWVVSAPMLTVGFYHNRAKAKALTTGFAARLGLLTGLLVAANSAAVLVAGMVLARFAFHSHEVDRELETAFAQVRTATVTQYGQAAAPVLHLMGIPEFRVGFLLWMVTVTAALYLLLSAVTAGLAGLLLSRRRTA